MTNYQNLGLISLLALNACLAPEPVSNGGGQTQSQEVNVYNGDTAGDTDTADADTDTDSDSDSDSDSDTDTADTSETGETGETGDTAETGDTDSGTDTADTALDTAGETGDTAFDTGDTAADTGLDSGIDTGAETGTDTGGETGADTGDTGFDTADDTDTAADTAVGDTADSGVLVTDADGDGFDAVVYGGSDCDDTDATVNPDADEVFNDGTDNDCDGDDVDWIDVEVNTTLTNVGEMWIYYGAGRSESGYSFPYQFTIAVGWLGERALNADFDPDGDGNVSQTGSTWTDHDSFVADQTAGEDVSNYVILASDDELSELASNGVDTSGFTALGGQASWFQVSAWDTTGAWMSLDVSEWSFTTDSWAFTRSYGVDGNIYVQTVGNNWDFHAESAGVLVTP